MATTAIYRKLRTNDPPTNQEAEAVRRALDGSLYKLNVIKGETVRLQERLAALCQKRNDTQNFVETHQGLLSPIRRIHRDILQEIFYQCLPIAHNAVLDPEVAPLVLGRVCRSWRHIAYSTPKLWSSLHIVAIPCSFYQAEERFEAISAWLSRSGALPLSISMSASGFRRGCRGRYAPINERIRSYMNLILMYVKRWRRIHISLLRYDWSKFFHLVNASDLPLLEVLHLEGNLVRDRDPMSIDISPLSRKGGILFSPLLRVLSLPDYSQRILELPVQWEQITALNLARHALPIYDVTKVFTLCSNLKACSVSIATPDDQPLHATASDIPPIVLPNLRSLKLIGRSALNDDLLALLDKLFTPILRHFAYERSLRPLPRPFLPESQALESWRCMKSLCSFFERINEPLEELDYWSNSLTRRGLMEVLSFVPGLKRLSLKDATVFGMNNSDTEAFISERSLDDRFLAQFIPHEQRLRWQIDEDEDENEYEDDEEDEENRFPTSICLCPKLEVFNSIDATYSHNTLLQFLLSRSPSPFPSSSSTRQHRRHYKHTTISPLHHASITFKNPTPPETTHQVHTLTKQIETLAKDTGMAVNLGYPQLYGPPAPLFFDDRSPYAGIEISSATMGFVTVGF